MGVVLEFYVVPGDAEAHPGVNPGDFRRNCDWFTRLRMVGKHYELWHAIYDLEEYGPTNFLCGSQGDEICDGRVTAGPLARAMRAYHETYPNALCADERAALAYLEAIPADRVVVVAQT